MHTNTITHNGRRYDLVPRRQRYTEYYEVRDCSRSTRGRLIGLVNGIYGARQYKPTWDACDAQGRPVGCPKGRMSALFPIGTMINPDRESNWNGGRLWPSRLQAVHAIIRRDRG